jgi:hypothetical protein
MNPSDSPLALKIPVESSAAAIDLPLRLLSVAD